MPHHFDAVRTRVMECFGPLLDLAHFPSHLTPMLGDWHDGWPRVYERQLRSRSLA